MTTAPLNPYLYEPGHDHCVRLPDAAGDLVVALPRAPALHVADGRHQHHGVGRLDASLLRVLCAWVRVLRVWAAGHTALGLGQRGC